MDEECCYGTVILLRVHFCSSRRRGNMNVRYVFIVEVSRTVFAAVVGQMWRVRAVRCEFHDTTPNDVLVCELVSV